MSHAATHGAGAMEHSHGGSAGVSRPQLAHDNITLSPGSSRGLATALVGLGAIGLAVGIGGSFAIGPLGRVQALTTFHAVNMACLAMCLGGMFLTLVTTLMNAGWTAALRRQFENLMVMLPVPLVGVVIVLVADKLMGSHIFSWMNVEFEGNHLLEKKAAWLNPGFFYLRTAIYITLWMAIARRLWSWSIEQDRTGDRMLTAKARRFSAGAILVFALTTAFAAFDWLKTVDFRFFSTMWGVYFFAGAAYSGTAVTILVVNRLLAAGKLQGVATNEHNHDLGKLMFSFTVFWAYISFSQYFLIWYSNIPEETSFFLARKQGGWQYVFQFLCLGHFFAPFVILLFRKVKQTPVLISALAAWSILAHLVDLYWVLRPATYAGREFTDKVGVGGLWVDAAIMVGVVAMFASFLVRRIASGPLVAVNDPRMDESLHHKNYV